MYTHGCVVASLFLSCSLFSLLSLPTESQPPGRTTELIDCALQIDFEQKVSALSPAENRRGGKRFRPRRAAHVFKKLYDFALSTRNGPATECVIISLSPSALHSYGRQFSAVVDRRDTLPRHASPSCGSIHSRNEIGTTSAGAIIWKLYSFLLSNARYCASSRDWQTVWGYTGCARRCSALSFYQCAFCKRIIIP